MYYTEEDAKDFIAENDVKFIRLAFVDIFGVQKNISIMPTELDRAFSTGISIDGAAVGGKLTADQNDLFLKPHPSTLSLLPWRPSHGRVVRFFCDIINPDGTPYELCSRTILKDAVARAKKADIAFNFGTECEFYLFSTDENGNPAAPYDNGSYMCIAPEDKGENIRREICLTLEEMNIAPESSHHEFGPGQNEIDFRYSTAIHSADNVITFRSVVRTIAARNGVFASFSPNPVPGKPGNGFKINISPATPGIEMRKIDCVESVIAGIMDKICDMTAFLNPADESYKRLAIESAPNIIAHENHGRKQIVRIPKTREEGREHFELRCPDSMANPYIAYALIINAAVDGIEKKLTLAKCGDDVRTLPSTHDEAQKIAANSEFIKKYLPTKIIEGYTGKYGN